MAIALRLPVGTLEATYRVAVKDVNSGGVLVPAVAPAVAPQDITSGPIDYIIVTHQDFVNTIERLAVARRAEGYSVRIVTPSQIYAQYNHSIIDAYAIQEYLQYAISNMGTKYILLLGDDNGDYRNYMGSRIVNEMPSLFTETYSERAFAAADPYTRMSMAIGFPMQRLAHYGADRC